MSNRDDAHDRDLRWVAAATAVAIGTAAMAALVYLLLDVLVVLFLGIIVAAALQPWHLMLRRWGIPKGLAVLGIYLLLLIGLVLLALALGPVLIEQITRFVEEAPATYASIRSHLQSSTTPPFHAIGQRLPPFERLAQMLTDVAPQFYRGAVDATTSVAAVCAYVVTVLVLAFYWTMEMPRIERLVLSLIEVDRRARVLNVWHDIESKLGGFIRGKGVAMLAIGVASAIGYALIGLPNVLALAVLAGLLEAVPVIGPTLAVAPAVIVALPLGSYAVLSVVGFTLILQLVENHVLVPRIMHRAVGVSSLVSILGILVFGTLYGFLGVLMAIPMTAIIQVLLESALIQAEPVREPRGFTSEPWAGVRVRIGALREQARVRLRARTSRMGIDPSTADHVVDAADQQIEVAVARVEQIIVAAETTAQPMTRQEQVAVETLRGATEEIERAVEHLDAIVAAGPDPVEASEASQPARADPSRATDILDRATQRVHEALQDAESLVVAAQEESKEGRHGSEMHLGSHSQPGANRQK